MINALDKIIKKYELLASVQKFFQDKVKAIPIIGDVAVALGKAGGKDTGTPNKPLGDTTRGSLNNQEAYRKEPAKEKTTELPIVDKYATQRLQIQAISKEFKTALELRQKQVAIETLLIGKGEEATAYIRAQVELTDDLNQQIQELSKAKAGLSQEELRAGLGKAYDDQIKKIQELADAERLRVEKLQEGLAKVKRAEEFRQYSIREEIKLTEQLRSIQDDYAKLTLTKLEQGYANIAIAARESAKAAIDAEKARRGSELSADEIKEYYAEAEKGAKQLISAQQKLNKEARTFSTGWKAAFKQYAEDAADSAASASRLFATFTQGLEDLFVDFAKTGKFQWKQFVSSLAEDLLRSNLKSAIAQVGSAFGLGDLFGGGGKGGLTRGNNPVSPLFVSVVNGGGGGGSVGGGIGSVISGASSAISNLIKTGTQIYDIATGGFGTIAKAVGDLFGGLFAEGGTLPAGKFGIVGEAGPELITGPAQITPFKKLKMAQQGNIGGGDTGQTIIMPASQPATTVNYYIQAADAASFKTMLAKDPSFVHAVVMQGAKNRPVGRS